LKRLMFALVFAVLFLVPSLASATTIDLSTSSPTIFGSPHVFANGGGSVTVTAFNTGNAVVNINDESNGIAPDGGFTNLLNQGEKLYFDFSPSSVTLLSSVVFEATAPENLNVYANGVLALSNVSVLAGTHTVTLGTLSGSNFTFEGAGPSGGSARVHFLTYTTNNDISSTPVPEPGSMMLLGTGLLGLAAGVRRSKGK